MAINLDAEWLQRAIQGDEEAFTRVVETYQRPVYNLCFRMLGQAEEAEDAAQETFWRAYQYLRRYDPQRSFTTWLLSIAAHYCIDQQRKRRRPVLALDILPDEDVPDPSPSPEKAYGRTEERARVQKMLTGLGEQDRAAIILRYWYDFSEEEIAAALHLTVPAVKSRLFRARKELAQAWETSPVAVSERKTHESPAL